MSVDSTSSNTLPQDVKQCYVVDAEEPRIIEKVSVAVKPGAADQIGWKETALIVAAIVLAAGLIGVGSTGLFINPASLPKWLAQGINTIGQLGKWPFWGMEVAGVAILTLAGLRIAQKLTSTEEKKVEETSEEKPKVEEKKTEESTPKETEAKIDEPKSEEKNESKVDEELVDKDGFTLVQTRSTRLQAKKDKRVTTPAPADPKNVTQPEIQPPLTTTTPAAPKPTTTPAQTDPKKNSQPNRQQPKKTNPHPATRLTTNSKLPTRIRQNATNKQMNGQNTANPKSLQQPIGAENAKIGRNIYDVLGDEMP